MIYLDTHVIVRLYQGDIEQLSMAAQDAVENNELQLRPGAREVTGALAAELDLKICDLPFQTVVDCALQEKWSRDPFDRLIVAHAKAQDAPLVTKDEKICQHYRRAIW